MSDEEQNKQEDEMSEGMANMGKALGAGLNAMVKGMTPEVIVGAQALKDDADLLKDPTQVLALPMLAYMAEEKALEAALAVPALQLKIDSEEALAAMAARPEKNDFDRKTKRDLLLVENKDYQNMLKQRELLKEEEKHALIIARLRSNQLYACDIVTRMGGAAKREG